MASLDEIMDWGEISRVYELEKWADCAWICNDIDLIEEQAKRFAFKAILCDIHEDCRDSPKLARKCRNERRKLEGW